MAKVMLIGVGHIGSTLYKRLIGRGYAVPFLVRSGGIARELDGEIFADCSKFVKYLKDVDAVCLTIPNTRSGQTAATYMLTALSRGKPVVTCEKGSLSNFFECLNPHLARIGYSAAVGGGTRMLRYARGKVSSDTEEVHAVLNGTLNFIFDAVRKGKTIDVAVEDAKHLGYTEPGAETLFDCLNAEACQDVPMKTAIVCNVLGLGKIRACDIKIQPLSRSDIDRLVKEASMRRFIVSFRKKKVSEDCIGGFDHEIDGWSISAGFKKIDIDPLYAELVPTGAYNALLISEGESGVYKVGGPGAGAYPTTSAMLSDLGELLRKDSQ